MSITTRTEDISEGGIREVEAKSILLKHRKIDSWFVSRYGMNLYRGCLHNCVYCDGRSEGYYVEGEFGKDLAVKVNAIEILRRELDPKRRRVSLKPGFIMMGGGVGDSYQPVERKYQLTRRALQLVCELGWPVHMLTKSTMVERDIDVLKTINEAKKAIVSFSFSSVDDEISSIFEPGVPPPSRRLETISILKKENIPCGMFMLPVIPFLTDTPEMMEETVRSASKAGVSFIIFGGMTLKDGKQKEYFMKVLQRKYPKLVKGYDKIYTSNRWGQATTEYYDAINLLFDKTAREFRMPVRVPLALYRDTLFENDLVVVILEHIDYLLKLAGRSSSYGIAARSISEVKEPLSTIKGELRNLRAWATQQKRSSLKY